MMRLFHAVMPKEERFFDLFERHSGTLVAGAKALRSMLEGGENVPQYCSQVMEREQQADDITREVLIAVRRSFITPFDRSDIKDLITAMDDSIDQMQKTAKAITLFEVRSFEPPMQQMGDAIVASAELVVEAMPLLRETGSNASRLNAITEKITRIEGQADDTHYRGLRELFAAHGRSDAMAFSIGNEIYDHLEKVVDAFDDVANEISSIVIEHA